MKKNNILENLIYLTVFLVPLYLVRIKIGFFSTNVLEIMIGAIFLWWFFSDKEKIKVKDFFIEYKKYIISGALMFLGILLSTFFSGNQAHSWGIIKSWFLAPLILFFLAWKVAEKEKIERIFWAYFFSAFFVALISLGYFIFGQITYDNRLSSIFNSPNYLAMYLAPTLIIALEQIKNEKLKVKSCGIFVSLIFIIAALYFTYSYATWISIVATFIILVCIKKNIFFKKIILIGSIILLLLFSQLNNKKLTDLLANDSRSSLASREMIWKASGKMIKENSLFGIGPGNFQKTYLEYQTFYPPYLEWAVPHSHNLYLTFWLSGGILGLVGFLSLVFFFLQDIFKKPPERVIFMALGMMLLILIHGIFDTTYFKNDLAIIFWLNFLVLK